MADLQCPYCPEARPSRSRLVAHLNTAHPSLRPQQARDAAQAAKSIETVVVTAPELAEPKMDDRPQVECVCGLPIVALDNDREYPVWTHVSSSGCPDAIPAAGVPTTIERAQQHLAMSEMNGRLKDAGEEMSVMREALDAIDEQMRKLDAQLTSPATVRRATLNQVWDRLVDAGHIGAASVVMKMIKNVVDD